MTIKTRLTLLFAGVVALLLLALMWSLYAYTSYHRSASFSSQLFVRALTAATVALENDEMSVPALRPFQQKLQNYQLPEESITIFDERNLPYFHSGLGSLGIDQELRRRAIAHAGLSLGKGDTQVVYFPYEDNGHLYIVEASAVDVAGLDSLQRLGWALLAGFAISIAAVCLVGWWFASRAMAPITATTIGAERISATDLHIRLDEGNGKDEIAKLAHAFNGMLDRLESAFHMQKQFIAHASHEIRTPLTILEGQLEVALLRARTEREYENVIRAALDDTRRLRLLANDLLLLARADSELLHPPETLHRMDEILFAALEELHRRYPDRRIDVMFDVPAEHEHYLLVRGNADLLGAALANVLENAIKYSEPPSPVVAAIGVDDRRITIDVSDSGCGIDEEELPHIFEPFFRGSRTSAIPGTGVGLALVLTVINHHRGAVTVESGAGTSVRITLPVGR